MDESPRDRVRKRNPLRRIFKTIDDEDGEWPPLTEHELAGPSDDEVERPSIHLLKDLVLPLVLEKIDQKKARELSKEELAEKSRPIMRAALADRAIQMTLSDEFALENALVEELIRRPTDGLRTLDDEAATVDALNRLSFACVISERLRAARAQALSESQGAFMTHLHGPWGSGKSSLLNFLRNELLKAGEGWIVIDFNAWKHHRLRPPWWWLIKAIYDTARASRSVPHKSKRKLKRIWWAWRLRADWLPILLVALTLGAVAYIATTAVNSGEVAKILVPLLTVGIGITGYIRFLLFGSNKAADIYSELRTDAYEPIVRLCNKLVTAIGCPIAVFIDDLDRCEADYVVELVEGIQTLLRSQPVSYVIAADRRWICKAFEKKYDDFSENIGEPGRPLGYLFLDKLFQISAGLPSIPANAGHEFWRSLLIDEAARGTKPSLSPEEAEKRVRGSATMDQFQSIIDAAPEADRPVLRAAAAVEITRSAAARVTEHALESFHPLLEPNPRAMKRLVNAVGLAQARCLLEARAAPLDTIARWTLIELRWPLLAEYLDDNVDAIDLVKASDEERANAGLPPPILALLADRQIRAIVAPSNGEAGLSSNQLGALLGVRSSSMAH